MTETTIVTIVEKATSEYLIGTDWSLNMQLCDYLNTDPSGSREAVRQVGKKMKEKKSRVALLALELLETLMKNCESVHPFVGGKEFQADIIKLAQNKKLKDNVRDRLLELVQYWADSFQKRHDLPLYSQTYMLLRKSGVQFPPRRKDDTLLIFRQNTTPPPTNSSANVNRERSASNPSSRDPAPIKEFGSLRESVNLCNEMLAYFNVEEEDPESNELLKDLIQTCKDSLPNVRVAIESGNFTSEAAMIELLSLNDEMTKMSTTFEELKVQRQDFLRNGPRPVTTTSSVKSPAPDFLDFTANSVTHSFDNMHLQHQPQPQPQPQLQKQQSLFDDDFGFLTTSKPQPMTQPSQPTGVAYNTFAPPPAVNPNHITSNSMARPIANNQQDDFDEFDLLANRHSNNNTPLSTTSPFQQPMPSTSPTTFIQPTTSTAYGAPYRPTQPALTPFQPQQPILTPLYPQQPQPNPYQPQPPILTPLQPQAPFLAPMTMGTYPNMGYQPNYAVPYGQPVPAYYNPMVQPKMGTTPPKSS